MGGIRDAHIDDVLAGTLESPLRQPHRQPGTTTGGVDNEIGRYRAGVVT